MHTLCEAVIGFTAQVPYAALAASPVLRTAAERRDSGRSGADCAFTVERVPVACACEKGVSLWVPAHAQEVLVVSLHGLARRGSVCEAAKAGMWWVDRCLQLAEAADASCPTLMCCVRVVEMDVKRLFLYCSATDGATMGSAPAGVCSLRAPAHPFALHMQRVVELRALHLSPEVSQLIVEVDVRTCLRWSQAEVNTFLTSLNAPLRAVRVPTVSLAAVSLLRRFHDSLRVLHLCRRTAAVFHDPQSLPMFDDEELEEDASTPPSVPTSAEVLTGKLPPPARRAAAPGKGRRTAAAAAASKPVATATSKGMPTATAETGRGGNTAVGPRRLKRFLRPPLDVTPVLEELHISSSVRHQLPSWVRRCLHLQRLTLNGCRYEDLSSLCGARGLREITIEGCNHLARFELLCRFPQLRALCVKNCALLGSIAWLPAMSAALRSLTVHHLSAIPLSTTEEATTIGVGLNHVESISLCIPAMTKLQPLLVHAAQTLRELTLFTCLSVDDFARLPALPSLERLCITGSRHMQSLAWLRRSPRLTEVRATQCTQLTSLAGLDRCPQLRMVEVAGASQLLNINALASCTALVYVDLSQCALLTSVSPLRRLPHLTCVLLRNCVQLSKDFEWVSGCPALVELALPSSGWYNAAIDRLQQLNRRNTVVLR
jgi:Leucine-rich repeat (LRR) protein